MNHVISLFQFGTDVSGAAIYLPHVPENPDMENLAYSSTGLSTTSYSPLMCEANQYLYWAYSNGFDHLSVPGTDLFENCVRFLMD